MNILFVCTGNTCRSSMAEGIMKHITGKSSYAADFVIRSAGTFAVEGEPANPKSVAVMKNEGIDISSHRAIQLNVGLINDSDVILVMTDGHKRFINTQGFNAEKKIYTLKEYAKNLSDKEITRINLDIADPYGMDYDAYVNCMQEIKTELEKIAKILLSCKIKEDESNENSYSQ